MKPLIGDYTYIDDLPEDARNFRIYEDDMRFLYFDTKYGWEDMDMKTLEPPGHWSIVGWSDEVDESEIVDQYVFMHTEYSYEIFFKDYTDVQQIVGKDYSLETARESFKSLLSSKSIETRVFILKKYV